MRASLIQLIPLFKGFTVTTDGTQLSKTTIELDVPAVRNLLPHCDALFLIGLTEGTQSGNIEWNVAFLSGFDRAHQDAAIDIASSPLGAPGSDRSTDYTSTQNFMLDTRLQLWWRNPSAVSGAKTAVLSCVLGARIIG